MVLPKDLTAPRITRLNYLARDQPERDETVQTHEDGTVRLPVSMRSNDVVLVTLGRSYKTNLNQKL